MSSIYRKHIGPALGKKRLDEISHADVMALKAKLASRNAKTVNNVLTFVTKMLKVAKRTGKLDEIPVEVELPEALSKNGRVVLARNRPPSPAPDPGVMRAVA